MADVFDPEVKVKPYNEKENLVQEGDDVNLTNKDPALRRITIGVGWDMNAFDNEAMDFDASCFLLDKNFQTREDSDFIFYNNTEGSGGAVKHDGDSRHGAGDGDDETISIDLHGVPFDVARILFAVSIYNAREKDHRLDMARNIYLRVVNAATGDEMARYELTDGLKGRMEAGVVVAALDREGPKWHFRPMREFLADLGAIAERHGIIIAEKASS